METTPAPVRQSNEIARTSLLTAHFRVIDEINADSGVAEEIVTHKKRMFAQEMSSHIERMIGDGRVYSIQAGPWVITRNEKDFGGGTQYDRRMLIALIDPTECRPGEAVRPSGTIPRRMQNGRWQFDEMPNDEFLMIHFELDPEKPPVVAWQRHDPTATR